MEDISFLAVAVAATGLAWQLGPSPGLGEALGLSLLTGVVLGLWPA